MATFTIQEAQAQLADLIHRLTPGEEVVITENNQPVAKLVSEPSKWQPALRPPPGAGLLPVQRVKPVGGALEWRLDREAAALL